MSVYGPDDCCTPEPADLLPLSDLKSRLHERWDLGRDIVRTWSFGTSEVAILTLPHYALGRSIASGDLATSMETYDVWVQETLAMPRPVAMHELDFLIATLRRFFPERSGGPTEPCDA